jgi:3-oxoacyl-[acyl-carrier-protein] synthase II
MSLGAGPRRVVVTGLGATTPLGQTFEESWKALLRKENGATSLEEALSWQGLSEEALARELEFSTQLPCQVAAPVRFNDSDSRTARFVQLALKAGKEALQTAKLDTWFGTAEHNDDPVYQQRRYRAGTFVGSGMSGVREVVEAARTVEQKGYRKLSPHFVPKVLSNSAAGRLSIEFHLQGPNHSVSTACAAGSHAIGDAMRNIQFNAADICLAGGAEACIDPLSLAGFCRLRALSTGFSPKEASRPFDRQRDGFVMGEGAAILVLEEYEHARARNAPILAELCGYGLSGDANHITAPDPNGGGAERAMRMAIEQSGIDYTNVGYINAHATSTPMGDEIESRVIDRTFAVQGVRERELFVSSTKGATGHLLGAAGAIEAAFTVQALVDQVIPPTLNLDGTEEELGFQHVRDVIKAKDMQAAMSNSFGFGGTNAALLFQKL